MLCILFVYLIKLYLYEVTHVLATPLVVIRAIVQSYTCNMKYKIEPIYMGNDTIIVKNNGHDLRMVAKWLVSTSKETQAVSIVGRLPSSGELYLLQFHP